MLRPTLLLTGLLLFLSSATYAAETTAAREEITHLTDHLAHSGCRFNRNGTWYGPDEAVAHLNSKLDYLRNKGAISTAESFIEQAASTSSASGKPYLVQCGQTPATESAVWFRAELTRYRDERKAARK